MRLAQQLRPDLILKGISFRTDVAGIEAAQTLCERGSLPGVFPTAYASDATLDKAKLAAPCGCLQNPFEVREFRTVVEIALDKHQAEERLRDSREELTAILRTAMDGFWLVDKEWRFLKVNDAYCQLSVFRVFLPVSTEAVPQKLGRSALVRETAGSGTVLVVDDETILRKALTTALKRLGFTVLAAKDGVEALEIPRRTPSASGPRRRSVHVIHHQVMLPLVDADLINRDDVRMLQTGGRGSLDPEPLHVFRAG